MSANFLNELVETVLAKDPAARSRWEVILCYPGVHALIAHRFAHSLWLKAWRTQARFVSHLARVFTGIEIHPGATIGKRAFIDHGMGVVIGETTVIGDDVVLYQGVTLGGGKEARMGALTRDKKRHPTLGNGVIVGSGAEIQGPINVGDNVKVASGSIVLKDVPANATVVGVPARVIRLEDDLVVDPNAEKIKSLKEALASLKEELAQLRKEMSEKLLSSGR